MTVVAFGHVFVGRTEQLSLFGRGLEDDRSRGLVISGPAGVGKSRLADECLARAQARGFRIARVTVTAATATVPLGAVAHLIPAGVDMSDPVAGFAAMARQYVNRDGRPLVVLVDDVHLLDAASAVLLRQLMDANVLWLLGTVRSGEPIDLAAQGLLHGESIWRAELEVLSRNEAEELLEAVLGLPVERRTVEELYATCEGNALYLRELVVGTMARGALVNDRELWRLTGESLSGTGRLIELIAARLAAAGADARPVLELLALCEPVSLADTEQAASPEIMLRLERDNLVRVRQDQRRLTVALAHPLYGEVLRAELPVLRRRELLLEQVRRMEASGRRRRDDALHVASWLLTATGTAPPALLIQAATIARYAHDYKQARLLLEALTVEHHTVTTRLVLGEVLSELGDPQRAEAVLADADAGAATEDETLAVTLARTLNLTWAAAKVEEALAINDAARGRVSSANALRMLRYNEGSMRIAAGEPAQGLALLKDLEEDVLDAPSTQAWLTAAMMKPPGLDLLGRTGEAVTWARRAHAGHLKVDHHTLYVHPAAQQISLVYALSSHGRLAEAAEVGQRAYAELIATRSHPWPQMWLSLAIGRAERLAGHPASARRWYAEALSLARTHHQIRPMRPALSGLAACAALLGDQEAAKQNGLQAREYPFHWPDESMGEAWGEAAQGRYSQARAILTDAVRTARDAALDTPEALLLTDLARLGGAKQSARRLAELARSSESVLVQACARLAEALVADDPDQLLEVATDLEHVGADLLAAEAAAAAAAVWRRADQPRPATAAANRSAAIVARCEGARTPLLATSMTRVELTNRERDIAVLAGDRLPSKDIATTLNLSVRTVDNYLQRIYNKLGITSRGELAAALQDPASRLR